MNESLDSRQLEAFVALSKTGSYTEAAKHLYVTHSAVCHSMKALEGQVGCRLLSKLRKKTILTEAGEAFLHHARRALDEMRQARVTVAELNKWGSRRLRLVVEPALASAILTPVLLKFYREFPQFHIHVEMNNCDDPGSLLENNRADLVLAEKPSHDGDTTFISLLADRFHFVVNADHPLASCDTVTRNELAKQPCLLLRTSGHGRRRLDDFLSQRGIGLSRIGEIEGLETIKEMVKKFPIMSILPGWTVSAELKNQTFVALPPGRKSFEQTWGIIHAQTRPLNHAEATLLKFCRQQVAGLS
ncbi:MAG: LysR family transcriptional regulator [Verrucomicrobiales bacterium]|nr:LysR family transcriptional regulator [Verrucomicrobiales bacterium]